MHRYPHLRMSTGIDPEIWNLENLATEIEAPRPKLACLSLAPNDRRVFAWSVRVHGLERCQSLTPGRIVWVHTPRYHTHASRYYIYIYSGLYKYMYMYMYLCISKCVCRYCYIDVRGKLLSVLFKGGDTQHKINPWRQHQNSSQKGSQLRTAGICTTNLS